MLVPPPPKKTSLERPSAQYNHYPPAPHVAPPLTSQLPACSSLMSPSLPGSSQVGERWRGGFAKAIEEAELVVWGSPKHPPSPTHPATVESATSIVMSLIQQVHCKVECATSHLICTKITSNTLLQKCFSGKLYVIKLF